MASRLSTKCTKRTNHPLNERLGLGDLSPCTESHRIKAGILPLATCHATRTTPKWIAEVHHLSLLSSLYRVESLETMFRPSLSEPDCWPPTDIFLFEEVWIEDTSATKPRAPNSPMLLSRGKEGTGGQDPSPYRITTLSRAWSGCIWLPLPGSRVPSVFAVEEVPWGDQLSAKNSKTTMMTQSASHCA